MPENSRKPRIVVVNTRAANVHSVEKALSRVGADPLVTSDPAELASADAVVLPGVGASDSVMRALNTMGLAEPVKAFAASGKPFLCICVGLQVLFESSEEGELSGLGLVEGNVRLIPTGMKDELGASMKVPHMGWNEVAFTGSESQRHPVFAGIPQGLSLLLRPLLPVRTGQGIGCSSDDELRCKHLCCGGTWQCGRNPVPPRKKR